MCCGADPCVANENTPTLQAHHCGNGPAGGCCNPGPIEPGGEVHGVQNLMHVVTWQHKAKDFRAIHALGRRGLPHTHELTCHSRHHGRPCCYRSVHRCAARGSSSALRTRRCRRCVASILTWRRRCCAATSLHRPSPRSRRSCPAGLAQHCRSSRGHCDAVAALRHSESMVAAASAFVAAAAAAAAARAEAGRV